MPYEIQSEQTRLAVENLAPFEQIGMWGCITACFANADRVLSGTEITPQDVDADLGRSPGDPTDNFLAELWLLRHGYRVEMFTPCDDMAYFRGEVSFGGFVQQIVTMYDPSDERSNPALYNEQSAVEAKKSYMRRSTELNRYVNLGRLITTSIDTPVPPLSEVEEFLDGGHGVALLDTYVGGGAYHTSLTVGADGGGWIHYDPATGILDPITPDEKAPAYEFYAGAVRFVSKSD